MTDVYSFGLLIWRVATDGRSPFDFIIPDALSEEQQFTEIERRKQADELKGNSALEFWYLSYIKKRRNFQNPSPSALTEVMKKVSGFISNPSLIIAPPDDLDEVLSQGMAFMLSQGLSTDLGEQYFMLKAHRDQFYGRIDAILTSCLGENPDSRDLTSAISLIQGRVECDPKYVGSSRSKTGADTIPTATQVVSTFFKSKATM